MTGARSQAAQDRRIDTCKMENKTASKASAAPHFDAVGVENRPTIGGLNRIWYWLVAICVVGLAVYAWATHRSAAPVRVAPAVDRKSVV